jgi:hypothetical protein
MRPVLGLMPDMRAFVDEIPLPDGGELRTLRDGALALPPIPALVSLLALLQLHFGLPNFDSKAPQLKIFLLNFQKIPRQSPLVVTLRLDPPNHDGVSHFSSWLVLKLMVQTLHDVG